MPRLTPQFRGDRPLSVELDPEFRGVDQRGSQPGLLAHAVNMRFVPGPAGWEARTRPGCITPVEWNPWFDQILGAGTFAEPGGRRVTLAAESYQVWKLAEGQAPQAIPLAADTVLRERCTITQVYTSCLICRGFGAPTLMLWEGRFRLASDVPNLTPEVLDPLPPTPFALMQGDRAWFPVDDSTLGYTDLLDYAHWDPILNRVPVNAGDADQLVAAVPWRKSVIIVLKSRSIYILTGTTGDLKELAVDSVKTPGRDNTGIGCWARDSVVEVGGDVLFLGRGGVYRLTEVLQESVQLQPQPMSEPVREYVARINWDAARQACAVVTDRLYLLAVPIDGSTVNNALLVYDTSTGLWQGMDVLGTGEHPPAGPDPGGVSQSGNGGTGMEIESTGERPPLPYCRQLLLADVHGQRVPLWVEDRRILALGLGRYDRIGARQLGIVTEGRTRAYLLGETPQLKRFTAMQAAFRTMGCDLSWRAVTDGANSGRSLNRRFVPDRRRWRVHGRPRRALTNVNDDCRAPHREDYSWLAGDGAQPRGGLTVWQPQDWTDGFPVTGQALWMALEWTSTTGTAALCAARADGLTDRNQLARSPS